jgi:arylsulfatase
VNVVVYVSDALRTDHLGCYGARHVDTRTVDELAGGGMRFSHAITAAPWTAPATTSIVTGLYAHRHGFLHWDAKLDPAAETMFRAFSAHGYDVASFVFDTQYLFKNLPEANVRGTSESLDGVFGWLRERREKPFLLYVHSWETHVPYGAAHDPANWKAAKREVIEGIQSDSALALETMREGYRKAVERQSEVLVASLLEELDSLGLREDMILAFLSDHGESWGERLAAKDEVQGVYHMHGATLFDEIVEVPLILSAPGRLEPGVVDAQVRTVDLVPTLLDVAGLPARETDGESLLRVDADRPAVIAGTDRGALTKLAVRQPPWKLILDVSSGEEEAYRLDVDPRELDSRPADVPPELRELVFRELESAERHELSAEEEATVAKRLSDLGYL